ncbi:mpv17-like protein 2 [Onthophagus taurus]|uniref:mpv17-like protein 2 n=1 Tax=Onthophagus taurus TaxID=166361 RepID=UPI0039BE73A2
MSILSKISKLFRPLKKHVGNTFHKAFTEYLLMTNIVSSVILMQLGDMIQQEVELHIGTLEKRYDYGRMFRMATTGIGYGVLHHYFYTNLDKLWPKPIMSHTIKKVVCDQVSMSPFCIVYFFYCAGILEGKNIYECTEELKEKFMNVYLLDCVVWPPSQYVNFLYVPVKYQVIYINVVTMFYDIFLSYIKHKQPETVESSKVKNEEAIEEKDKFRNKDRNRSRVDTREDTTTDKRDKKLDKKQKKVKDNVDDKKEEDNENTEGGELKKAKSGSVTDYFRKLKSKTQVTEEKSDDK